MMKMLIVPMTGLLVSLGAALAAGPDGIADDANVAVVARLEPAKTTPSASTAAAPERRTAADLPADGYMEMPQAELSDFESWWLRYGETLGRAE